MAFQPSLLEKILRRFGNRSGKHQAIRVTSLSFNKKSLSFEINDLLKCKNEVSHNAFSFLLLWFLFSVARLYFYNLT